MTRINIIEPSELTDQHLIAEYREIFMVGSALQRSLKSKNWEKTKKNLPKEFTLNAGHVKFFFNKGSNGKRIEVVSNYQDLKNMIPWNPPVSLMKNEVENSPTKAVEYTTNLGEISADNFQIKTFTYRTRGPNNTVKYKISCIINSNIRII